MKTWLAAVLFLACIFLDGIIFPALFGFRESFLTIIFLVGVLLCYKADFQGLTLGVVFFGLAEFSWGLKLGALILPLLVSAGVFFLLNRFFNIRSKVSMTFSWIIMLIVFWEMSVVINKIL